MVPGPDAGELDWLLFEQAGILTAAQAAALIGWAAVRWNLRQRRWRRICRNVLSNGNGRLTHRQHLWVAVLVAGQGAYLAGATAVAEHGVTGVRTDSIQVLIPAIRTPSARPPSFPPDMPGVQIHRTTVLPDHHRQVGRPPRTTIARAVIDAAAWAARDREALTIIAAACQQRRADPAELRAVLALFPKLNRRRLIRTTIADLEGGADALSEIDLMALCRRHRLPRPDFQHPRADADGRTRFIDAYWPEHRLQVEVDGGHHMDARHWAADMLRQNQIWIAGDRILRFPAWLIRTDPAAVVAQLRAALDPHPRTT